MFKKFLAALTTIALSLGMVALTAGPASAHHNTISVSVSCNTGAEGYWKATWSVTNSESDKSETITSSTDTSLVPIGTVIAAGATATFVEYFSAKPSSNKKLILGAQWSNGVTKTDDATLHKSSFSDDCLPDDTDHKVWICHANNGEGTGGFVKNEVDIDSIIKANGHAQHHDQRDIIPPFTYVKQGVPGSFPGLNWNPPYSQAFLDAGCQAPTVTPAAPTFTEATCTAPGQAGSARYVIPATVGIAYTVQINGAGGFVEQAANTYFVPVGTMVEVQAVALTGYALGTPNYWSATFLNMDCIVTVTPTPATFSVLECVEGEASQQSYTIPTTAGVTYTVQINGVGGFIEKAANTYNVSQGTTVEVKAVALTGYTLTGVQEWSTTFATIDCRVTPTAPSFTPAVCTPDGEPGSYGTASYTIPVTAGVKYEVRFADNGSWADVAAGTHNVDAGQYVEVRAVAVGDYVLKGTLKWTKNFTAPDCIEKAPIEPVVTSDQLCVVDDFESGAAHYESGTITIPNTPNVTYSVDGVATGAGVHDYEPGTYTISAAAASGYELTGVPDPWKVTVNPDEPCGQFETLGDVLPSVAFAQTTCSASGSYTLGAEPFENGAGIVWTVSGGLPNTIGTYTVTEPGTVTVVATAAPGFGLSGDQDGIMEWSFDFTSFPDGCLPTLALTGGSVAAGGLGLSALLAIGGVLLIAARRRDVLES